jgi:hypothetical protein
VLLVSGRVFGREYGGAGRESMSESVERRTLFAGFGSIPSVAAVCGLVCSSEPEGCGQSSHSSDQAQPKASVLTKCHIRYSLKY